MEPLRRLRVEESMLITLSVFSCALAEPAPAPAPAPAPTATAPATVRHTFPPPAGARRVEGDSFATYLRDLRVLPEGTPVTTHAGDVVRRDARVLDLPLVPGDLQQCADTAIRLRAEWLRSTDQPVLFHATSGDPMPWDRYARGERARDAGNRLEWRPSEPSTWEGYLQALFTWAGTASLAERDTVADDHPDPGDILVQPGFPGHAVILLDVATTDEATWVLVGQGYMPAQSLHVEPGPKDGWFAWDDHLELSTWPLDTALLRRWR